MALITELPCIRLYVRLFNQNVTLAIDITVTESSDSKMESSICFNDSISDKAREKKL